MLSVIKYSIDSWIADEDTETEDEGMEDVKIEHALIPALPAATSSSTADQMEWVSFSLLHNLVEWSVITAVVRTNWLANSLLCGCADESEPMQVTLEGDPSESDTARHQGIAEAEDLNVKPTTPAANGNTGDNVIARFAEVAAIAKQLLVDMSMPVVDISP
jgi:hypothetical protein